ncbi:response regulator transcription factor [Cryptosporangium minutisporangium]|uniref:Response regulator transcription factor n=1 Tax=Cryptosporangium minutisporangium TaxID=113569 RepID=A0ABP6SRY6_9ACTN
MPVRVAIAEDDVLLRAGLSQLIAVADGLDMVGTAADLPSILELVEAEQPDLVITDVRMPPTGTDEGIQLATRLRRDHPRIGVIVLSQYHEPAYALALLNDGVEGRGYLLKERVAHVRELTEAVRRVAEGGSVIDPAVVAALVRTHSATRNALDALSPRESEVLAEMAQGKNNLAIARTLHLTERAVEKHANQIFGKLDLASEPDINRRVRAVLMFLDHRK